MNPLASPLAINVQQAAKAAPAVYTVPGSTEVELLSAFATYNGAAAVAPFRPALTFYSDGGLILARVFPGDSVAAGGSADVTFAPFLGADSASANPGPVPSPSVIYDFTVSTPQASIDTLVDGTYAGTLDQTHSVINVYGLFHTDGPGGVSNPNLAVQVNSDVGANYDQQYAFNSTPTAFTPGNRVAQTSWLLSVHGNYSSNNYPGVSRLTFPGYTGSTLWKTAEAAAMIDDASATFLEVSIHALGWRSANPLTSFKYSTVGGGINFTAGSRLTIVGS